MLATLLFYVKDEKKTPSEVIDMYSFRDWQEKGFAIIETSFGGRRIRTGWSNFK